MSVDDEVTETRRIYNESQGKFCYFLLAAAAASLGYGLQLLHGKPITPVTAVGELALFSWLISFAYGCFRIKRVHSAMNKDHRISVVRSWRQPQTPELDATIESARNELRQHFNKAVRNSNRQQFFLAVGAFLFLSFHLIDVIRLSSVSAPAIAQAFTDVATTSDLTSATRPIRHSVAPSVGRPCASQTEDHVAPPGCAPHVGSSGYDRSGRVISQASKAGEVKSR